MLPVQPKIVSDFGEKRSNGEPDEKGDKESPPRAVEGSHVRSGNGTKLDCLGLVILARVDIDPVFVILLPFGLQFAYTK